MMPRYLRICLYVMCVANMHVCYSFRIRNPFDFEVKVHHSPMTKWEPFKSIAARTITDNINVPVEASVGFQALGFKPYLQSLCEVDRAILDSSDTIFDITIVEDELHLDVPKAPPLAPLAPNPFAKPATITSTPATDKGDTKTVKAQEQESSVATTTPTRRCSSPSRTAGSTSRDEKG